MHTMYSRSLIILVVALLGAAPLVANDAWLVRFSASGQQLGAPCAYINWVDTITLHNDSSGAAVVRLLGVSNGTPRGNESSVTLAPGQSRLRGSGDDWRPLESPPLWVVQLDVPSGVVVASHADVNQIGCSVNPGGAHVGRRGAIPLRVVPSLTPANRRQVLLRPDIGFTQTGGAFSVIANRINVGVYNAGTRDSTAVIEVRRVCDDGLIERRSVALPANTIQQFGGFSNPGTVVDTCNTQTPFETYVTVTQDQPGFSYAVALSNESLPFVPVGVGSGN